MTTTGSPGLIEFGDRAAQLTGGRPFDVPDLLLPVLGHRHMQEGVGIPQQELDDLSLDARRFTGVVRGAERMMRGRACQERGAELLRTTNMNGRFITALLDLLDAAGCGRSLQLV